MFHVFNNWWVLEEPWCYVCAILLLLLLLLMLLIVLDCSWLFLMVAALGKHQAHWCNMETRWYKAVFFHPNLCNCYVNSQKIGSLYLQQNPEHLLMAKRRVLAWWRKTCVGCIDSTMPKTFQVFSPGYRFLSQHSKTHWLFNNSKQKQTHSTLNCLKRVQTPKYPDPSKLAISRTYIIHPCLQLQNAKQTLPLDSPSWSFGQTKYPPSIDTHENPSRNPRKSCHNKNSPHFGRDIFGWWNALPESGGSFFKTTMSWHGHFDLQNDYVKSIILMLYVVTKYIGSYKSYILWLLLIA